jgi:hypothetical protein
MKKTFISILVVWTLFACKQPMKNFGTDSFNDSIVREYLSWRDTLFMSDTLELDYRVLRAYKNNDTAFFRRLQKQITQLKQYKRWQDTFFHLAELKDIGVYQAYRFYYSAGYCDKEITLTITEKDDSINEHFIFYDHPVYSSTSQLPVKCHIITEGRRKLTKKDWYNFEDAIDSADFWGLKEDNGERTLDGNSLSVEGYIAGDSVFKTPAKHSGVWRVSSERTGLFKMYLAAARLAAIEYKPKGMDNTKKKFILIGPCTLQEEK